MNGKQRSSLTDTVGFWRKRMNLVVRRVKEKYLEDLEVEMKLPLLPGPDLKLSDLGIIDFRCHPTFVAKAAHGLPVLALRLRERAA